MRNRNKLGYINKKGHAKTTSIIVLSVAVLIALLLLGLYTWKNRGSQPDENVVPSPTLSAVTIAPTVTSVPTQPPTPTIEPTVAPTATPTPTPKPSVTPIPKLGFEPVRALYLRPKAFQDSGLLDHYIDLANKTEINSYVIDIKSDWGMLQYTSEIEDAVAANACLKNFDLRKVIKKFHDNDIRVIGRLVTFKDSVITKYKPEMAIHHNGALFDQSSKGDGVYWLDPTNKDSWDYILEIVKEVINFGIDEIQFDYVRFPESNLYEYELLNEEKERREYIEEFLAYIRKNVPEGTILSADVFGMPLISKRDYGEIGQMLETIGWDIDYISPMIYPSHFANSSPSGSMSNGVGQVINGIKFTHPDLQPYEVVYNTLMVGKKRLEAVEGYQLKCRAYIQGFTANYLPTGYWKEYGVEEYRAQIQAVYDAGYDEWIFWNASNNYVEEAFLPD
ncbi:MAG: hypothetical protein GX283_03240 [Clostridiaceae bacterium]|jgi:hypothetical protein|nr:hypothetical protein [Clostridiaceae bacterium]